MSRERKLYKTASDGWKSDSVREEAVRGLGNLAKKGSQEAVELLERIMRNGWKPDWLRKLAARMLAEER